ncbi:HGR102Cp [Eremothecium sinecaudum]|uniref:HGR102Cp n=1 Tax=Eremothecium sinecaudum TaxID=45286 RepID=A0A120K2S5_9SACH|nr:HGR102Cp [Eremothecium sinecaudum]AMD22441.1 HGR102Cp [Eremothecium sinecaudum]
MTQQATVLARGPILNGNETLHSCLKAIPHHRRSTSQVRFSLPACEKVEEYYLESKNRLSRDRNSMMKENINIEADCSKSHIVYPMSPVDEPLEHFVDLKNKVTVPVPRYAWLAKVSLEDPPQKRDTRGHLRTQSELNRPLKTTSSSLPLGHIRSKSLQSFIVDMVNGYESSSVKPSSKPADGDMMMKNTVSMPAPLEQLSISSPRELFLKADSPLNRYRVPVPLELEMPPFLSPFNHNKQRNSLVFDGQGYSVFNADHSDASYNEDGDNGYSLQDCPVYDSTGKEDTSDLSIPSAANDLSINLSYDDVDVLLGIDNEANVNLKEQVINLRNSSPLREQSKMSFYSPSKRHAHRWNSDVVAELPDSVVQRQLQSHNRSRASLPLMAMGSLSKSITIPDFEKTPAPRNSEALSGFFSLNDEETIKNTSPSPERVSNETFKFPRMSDDINSDAATNVKFDGSTKIAQDVNFLKIPEETVNPSVEQRRQNLQKQRGTGHQHKRSRSIHVLDDLFAAAHPTTPMKNSQVSEIVQPESNGRKAVKVIRIPERSPLRPKSALVKPQPHKQCSTNSTPVESNGSRTSPMESILHTVEEGINRCINGDAYVDGSRVQIAEQKSKDIHTSPIIFNDGNGVSKAAALSRDKFPTPSKDVEVVLYEKEKAKGDKKVDSFNSRSKQLTTYCSFKEPLPKHRILTFAKISDIHNNTKELLNQQIVSRAEVNRKVSVGVSNSSHESEFSAVSSEFSHATIASSITVPRSEQLNSSKKGPNNLSKERFLVYNNASAPQLVPTKPPAPKREISHNQDFSCEVPEESASVKEISELPLRNSNEKKLNSTKRLSINITSGLSKLTRHSKIELVDRHLKRVSIEDPDPKTMKDPVSSGSSNKKQLKERPRSFHNWKYSMDFKGFCGELAKDAKSLFGITGKKKASVASDAKDYRSKRSTVLIDKSL